MQIKLELIQHHLHVDVLFSKFVFSPRNALHLSFNYFVLGTTYIIQLTIWYIIIIHAIELRWKTIEQFVRFTERNAFSLHF